MSVCPAPKPVPWGASSYMCEGQWQGEHLETQMGNTGLNRGNLFLAVGVLGGPFSVCHSPQDSAESAGLFLGAMAISFVCWGSCSGTVLL